MKAETLRTLGGIDWDFAVPRSGYIPPPHWYPGTFVPAMSTALIEALTPLGGKVFDPYGGIGTTGWSAVRSARSCHIADVNPVALLVAYVTTSLLALPRSDRGLAEAALGLLSRLTGKNDCLLEPDMFDGAHSIDQAIELVCAPSPAAMSARVVVGPPVWESLRPWFDVATLSSLETLVDRVSRSDSAYLRLLGFCMISATARALSSQHASWGHIADNVRPSEMKPQNVHSTTTRWLTRVRAFLRMPVTHRPSTDVSLARAEIHLRDWSNPTSTGPGDADLLLTSPPYADAIDYTLAQRLSLYLLGYDDEAILALVSSEIGARRKRFGIASRTRWSELLCGAMGDQVTWLKPDGIICLVLPHKDSGRSAGEDDLKASLERLGMRLFFERHRSIHQSHTRQSWTSIKKEVILAFSC